MSSSSGLSGQFRCPHCKRVIRYPASKAGLSGKCPGCGGQITLPAIPESEASPPAPASPRQELMPLAAQPAPIRTEVIPASPKVAVMQAQNVAVAGVADDARADLSNFVTDGQNPAMIFKLLARVKEICTSSEDVLYMAVQQKPVANLSPDAVVLTSKRALVFRQSLLGKMEFVDILWANMRDIHVKENLIGATLTLTDKNEKTETVDYLPKPQARKVYRHGQEMEEKMIEWRRQRMMEEQRNAADQVIVNTAVATPTAPALAQAGTGEDPMQRLAKLRAMLDAQLITQDEFDTAKAKILNSL